MPAATFKEIQQPVTNPIVAIALSDIHLSLMPPVARAAEPDWFKAMARPWYEIKFIQNCLNVPILAAGDIFHYWRSPPELINWAVDTLPFMYAIPGQHDLPQHEFGQVRRSAYWTLEHAGTIKTVTPRGEVVTVSTPGGEDGGRFLHVLRVYGFPWNVDLTPPSEDVDGDFLSIALLHKYLWVQGASFQGASEEAHLFRQEFYHKVTIVGDNHKPFEVCPTDPERGNFTIWNNGGLYRRHSDEVAHKPRIGLIHLDGTVEPHYLDCSADVIAAVEKQAQLKPSEELAEFMQKLASVQGALLDYPKALREALGTAKPGVRKFIVEALGASGEKVG